MTIDFLSNACVVFLVNLSNPENPVKIVSRSNGMTFVNKKIRFFSDLQDGPLNIGEVPWGTDFSGPMRKMGRRN